MKYYRGITSEDIPVSNAAYVKETGNAHEAYNFDAIELDGEKVCLGFVMLIGNSATSELQIRIENIVGTNNLKNDEEIEGVTVVWCAKNPYGKNMRVVGFYKNATVYRHTRQAEFQDSNYVQYFNFICKEEDCVLLPYAERNKFEWFIPASGRGGYNFGFGRSNIWFANSKDENDKADAFLRRMQENIMNYSGENLMEVLV